MFRHDAFVWDEWKVTLMHDASTDTYLIQMGSF